MMRLTSRAAQIVAVALLLPSLVGCPSVTVHRINDQNRDTAAGFRFYLPRPYVVVKKAFPVAGEDFVFTGVSQDGRTVEIDTSALPPALRQTFNLPVAGGPTKLLLPLSTVKRGRSAPAAAPGAQRQGAAPTPAGGSADKAEGPATQSAEDLLAGSSVTPPILQPSRATFSLTVALAKSASFNAVKDVTPGLVPISSAGPDPSGFVAARDAKEAAKYKKGDTDGSYTGTGLRSDLKQSADYAVALKLKAQATATDDFKETILFGTSTQLHVVDAKEEKKTTTEADKKENKDGTKAAIETDGDPHTSPIIELSQLFDVVMLPDFAEQYAIDASAGTGVAEAKIGLEQGWMVERASMNLNNEQIGKLISSSVEKFVDTGLEIVKDYVDPQGALADAAGAAVQQGLPGAKAEPEPVVVRIRLVQEAQPGLYPVLKPNERPDPTMTTDQRGAWVFVPYRPYTVVAYNVRRFVRIETLRPAKDEGNGKPPAALQPTSAEETAIATWVRTVDPKINPAAPSEFDPQLGTLTIYPKEAPADPRAAEKKLNDALAKVDERRRIKAAGRPVKQIALSKRP